jgi:hypothetical protein
MVAFGDLHVEDGMVSGVRMRGGGGGDLDNRGDAPDNEIM